jgi:putative ABC transport system ATP-binding protein
VKPTEAVLAVRGLRKEYGVGATRVEALRGLELSVAPGEFVALMGSSGSGKSTLLHLLAGLDEPSAGSIEVGGVDLASLGEDGRTRLRRGRLGLIFQSFHLLDTLSALENVALPLAIAGHPAKEIRRRALAALECVGLGARRGHRPDQLSGGEQQRVAIARALVIQPLVLLADEPTGNLDSVQGVRIITLLRRLVDERGQTLVMVTHDASHAAYADRILRLHDGQLVEEYPTRHYRDHAVRAAQGKEAWAALNGGGSAFLTPPVPWPNDPVLFARPDSEPPAWQAGAGDVA